MLVIKKISVTPLPENEGKIINSFNTSDDKTTNAPSINAVKNFVNGKIAYVDVTENSITSELIQEAFAYPTGFTKTNCVVLGLIQIRYQADGTTISTVKQEAGYNFYDTYGGNFNAFSYGDNYISATINLPTYDKKIVFRLVLMRID